jgi:hypothetical protein
VTALIGDQDLGGNPNRPGKVATGAWDVLLGIGFGLGLAAAGFAAAMLTIGLAAFMFCPLVCFFAGLLLSFVPGLFRGVSIGLFLGAGLELLLISHLVAAAPKG